MPDSLRYKNERVVSLLAPKNKGLSISICALAGPAWSPHIGLWDKLPLPNLMGKSRPQLDSN